MSVEGQIDLDALIQNDRKSAKFKKTKQIEKERHERQEKRKWFQEERRKKIQQRNKNRYKSHHEQTKLKKQNKPFQEQNFQAYYAIKITGLLSDVSVDDICKLLGNRKIISIKTLLRNKDRQPIDSYNPALMEVVVVLADKTQADTFVKSFTDKKLDGKYQLAFSFVNPNDELD